MTDFKETPATTGINVAYIRVSTADQKPDRQRAELEKYGISEWFSDIASGRDTKRPELEAMLRFVRKGDTVYVLSMDRLARNLKDLISTVDSIQKKGAGVFFVSENLKIGIDGGGIDPLGRLVFSVMGAVSEFERALILERQREGIALARERGVYKGRIPIKDAVLDKAREKLALGIPARRVARDLGISYSTLYRRIIRSKAAPEAVPVDEHQTGTPSI